MKNFKNKIAGFSALLSIIFLLSLMTGCSTSGGGSGSTTTTVTIPHINMFLGAAHKGDLTEGSTYPSARAGADAIVAANLPANHLEGKTSRALISISDSDNIKNMPTTYGFSSDIPIYNNTGTVLIADNWADLCDGTIKVKLECLFGGMSVSSVYWWSGSDANGGYTSGCEGWTNGSAGASVGSFTTTDSVWLSSSIIGSSANKNHLIGIAY
jgi:hypothetical protein